MESKVRFRPETRPSGAVRRTAADPKRSFGTLLKAAKAHQPLRTGFMQKDCGVISRNPIVPDHNRVLLRDA
jgi:hypothetical protein